MNREAYNEYMRNYRQENLERVREVSRKSQKKYQSTKKGKITAQKHEQTEKGRVARLKQVNKYHQTKRGRITIAKARTKRRKNLNWILMFSNPFNDSVLVDYHHVTDVYVVAVPRDLHQLHYGKYHRKKTMDTVKQIYLGDSNE